MDVLLFESLGIGAVLGLLLGLTGAGGSLVALPLLLSLHLPLRDAIGVSLGAVALSALIGAIPRARQGQVAWRPVLVLALAGLPSNAVGQWLGRFVPEGVLILAGKHRSRETHLQMSQLPRAVVGEPAQHRVECHAEGAQAMQDRPREAGPQRCRGLRVERVVVAVEAVVQGLLRTGRQVESQVGCPFRQAMRRFRHLPGTTEGVKAPTAFPVARPGENRFR